jgi:hypothetical protein
MKNCSTSLTVKEMQINTALRFHFTQGRMASKQTTIAGEDVRGKKLLVGT